jgi:hypothetical protein
MTTTSLRRTEAANRRRSPRSRGVAALAVALAAAAAGSARPADLRDLAAFAGCWRSAEQSAPAAASYTEEIWSAPTVNLMLGLTLFVRDGRAVQYELTRVELQGDAVVMTPYPNGTASEHGFVLTSSSANEAVFEAPEHDYPKRILYRTDPDGSRTARIDGGAQDPRGQEWRFRRVDCPGSSR